MLLQSSNSLLRFALYFFIWAIFLPCTAFAQTADELQKGSESLIKQIEKEMKTKKRWSEVAAAMEELVHQHGFSLVEKFVGHGIGQEMHEEPQVPNFVDKSLIRKDIYLEEGLVLAIEPMVNVGTKEVRVMKDHWTVQTKDQRLSAHFEHTVAMTSSGPEILTTL